MPAIAIVMGLLLVGIGGVGYVGAVQGWFVAPASPTALIPAGFGVALALCGIVVLANESARKHAMHAAAMVALLGVIGALVRPIMLLLKGELNPTAAPVICQFLMAVVCATFVVLAIRSFREARRRREQAGAAA